MPTNHNEILWQTAGFVLEDGRVDRPISSEELVILPTSIDGDDLVWGTNWAHAQFRPPGKGLLSEFLKLSQAPPNRILRFARRWGAINFGFAFKRFLKSLETTVAPEHIAEFAENWIGPVLRTRHLENRDPITAYSTLSNHVHGVLRLARDIEDEQIPDSVWEERYPYHCESCLSGKSAAIDRVQSEVNFLVRLGDVRFTLERDDEEDRWRTAVSYGVCATLGALSMQIVLMASRADSLYTCSGCGIPYIRTYTHHRRPKPNQNNYCEDCGVDQAKLDAKKRYRRKIQEARRMHGAGIPINRIAEQLDTEPENVENWLGEQHGGQGKTRK